MATLTEMGCTTASDVDDLVANIANQTGNLTYDMTGDGQLNFSDLNEWLSVAGAVNLPSGNAYLLGDADLNGVVDGADFITWNDNKFTSGNGWCGGDFNADGTTDGQDFILWNDNKFTSSAVVLDMTDERVVAADATRQRTLNPAAAAVSPAVVDARELSRVAYRSIDLDQLEVRRVDRTMEKWSDEFQPLAQTFGKFN